jgi:ethanolamine utilization protein EutP (predicted NTPase)
MATWRVIVKADTAEKMDIFKNEVSRFKKLYSHGGTEAIFELPESNEAGADAMVADAIKEGFTARKEKYEDPLDSVETSADFW